MTIVGPYWPWWDLSLNTALRAELVLASNLPFTARRAFGIQPAFYCHAACGSTGSWVKLQSTVWSSLQRTCWTLHPHCQSTPIDPRKCFHWLHLEGHLHWWDTAHQEEEQAYCTSWDWTNWLNWQGQREDHWSSNQLWWGDCDCHWLQLRLSMTLWSLMHCFWTLLCWLKYWSLGSRFTEGAIFSNTTCTLHHVG